MEHPLLKHLLKSTLVHPFACLVLLIFSWTISTYGQTQTCSIISHNAFTDFNASSNPGVATTLWLSVHTKLNGSQLTANGDFLLFSSGTLSFNGITTSFGSSTPLPNGEIIADNTVSTPTTSFDVPSNTWITKVPPGYSSSDIFLSGAAITSSNGFSLSGGSKSTVLSGILSSNKTFSSSWFYGLAAYQPTFTNSTVGSVNVANGIPVGGRKTGTPNDQTANLIHGGSGGGGSNFTGSNSSTDNFTTCQRQCTSTLSVSATVLREDFESTCTGSVIVSVSGGVAPFTFVWSDGVTTTTNSRDNLCGPTDVNPAPVSYTVVVTDANGCTGSASFLIDLTTVPPRTRNLSEYSKSAGEANTTVSASLYPNPARGVVHLLIQSKERSSALISVMDMTGRIVKTFTINLEQGMNNKELPLQIRSSGVYTIQIKTSKINQTLPIRIY